MSLVSPCIIPPEMEFIFVDSQNASHCTSLLSPTRCPDCRAAELGSRGGRRRTVYSPQGLKDFAPPKTAADLRDLIAQSIIEIRTGKLDPKMANSISYLGTGFLRALEVSDLESRLQALESRTECDDEQSEKSS